MKKLFTFISILLLLIFLNSSYADYPVSKERQLKNVIFEVYTGINCGPCVGGHKLSEKIMADHPDRVFVINTYIQNTPDTNKQDFVTPWHDSLMYYTGLSGIPSASVNRQLFYDTITGMYSNYWERCVDIVLNQISPVNIGAKVTWLTHRTLKVDIELYFTEDTPPNNLLNIALLESGIIGYQADIYNFEHNHILRNLSSQWGDTISEHTKGTLVKKTMYINLIDDINPWKSNLDIVIFLSQNNHQNIYTGTQVHIEDKAPEQSSSCTIYAPGSIVGGVGTSSLSPISIKFRNLTNEDITLALSVEKSETIPDDWICEITSHNESEIIVQPNVEAEVEAKFEIGKTIGYGTMMLKVYRKIDDYLEPYIAKTILVSTDYDELFVDGSILGGLIKEYIKYSSFRNIPKMPKEIFSYAVNNNFSKLKILIWDEGNVGDLSRPHADLIYRLLSKGCNAILLGSTLHLMHHKALSYLGIKELGDSKIGYNSSPFTVTGIEGDVISGNMIDKYVSSLKWWNLHVFSYTNTLTTKPFIRYGEDSQYLNYDNQYINIKADTSYFGFRFEKGNQRAVYIAESPNIINDSAIAADLTLKILGYVAGTVSVEEFDKSFENLTAAPNPFTNLTNVSFEMNTDCLAKLYLTDSQGNKVEDLGTELLKSGLNKKQIESVNLSSGLYFFVIDYNGQRQVTKLIINK